MFKLINRYILYELSLTFVIGLIAFTSMLIMGGLVQKAISEHLPFEHIIRLIPYVAVEVSRISVPVTLLLAVTTFFAKMSGNNEIIALKSLGVPPRTLLMPVWAICVVMSIFAVWVNEMAVTWGQPGMAMVIYHGAEDILLEKLRSTHRFETANKDLTIMVRGVENKKLIKPTIISKKEGATIEAQSAEIHIDFTKETMSVTLIDIRVSSDTGSFKAVSSNWTIEVALSDIVNIGRTSNNVSNMGLERIRNEVGQNESVLEQQRRTIAAHQIFGGVHGSVDEWVSQPVSAARSMMKNLQSTQNRLNVESPRRWATGFSCFCFVWLGAPLAIWMRKTDFFSSFFACFLPILLFYYPLFMFGLSQAKSGDLPPMIVWVANLGVLFAGFVFLQRIHRY
ncbi:hypothetical protein FACS189454_10250 [Planctomycetales bacterium]|nr:hypothetical protein FACS189454_10250 [Planctomycetales bacterium]